MSENLISKPQRNWLKKEELRKYHEDLRNGKLQNISKLPRSTAPGPTPTTHQNVPEHSTLSGNDSGETLSGVLERLNSLSNVDGAMVVKKNNQVRINIDTTPVMMARRPESHDEDESSEISGEETEGSESDEYSSDVEDESDESDEEMPVFVPKVVRTTVLTEEEKLRQEQDQEEKRRKLQEEKVLKSKAMVARILVEREMRREKDEQIDDKKIEDIPNDDDDIDPEGELERWKERELLRLIESCKTSLERRKEVERINRRRGMTDEEIMEENRKLGLHQGRDKGEWNFLQKYYHQGAFFQDSQPTHSSKDDDIFNRPILPTGLEKVDKSVLPTIMQKRDFGKKSQSKYTHLTDQDTTDFTYGYGRKDSWAHEANSRYQKTKYNQSSNRSRGVDK